MGSQDTEITLGTGKMLGLFFGLVALCGVFFGVGYSLGRTGARPALSAADSQTAAQPALRPPAVKSGNSASPQSGDGLTFYKAVEQTNPNPQLPAPDASKDGSKEAAAKASSDPKETQPTPPDPMAISATGYYVQVAAVSKPDDAQALVDALKKKQYAAFTTNSSPADKFFHVQVGPFPDVRDAEATKAKLISDGYNPILKK
jgi:DedD protein